MRFAGYRQSGIHSLQSEPTKHMRKLLLLIPLMATGLLMTGCDEVAYSERTVVYDDGPGYYGDDFYYVSSRPYSRVYGQLYLRGGRYYYSRGGTYVVYDRGGRRGHDRRDWDRGRERRDWDRDRDRDRDRDDDRRRSYRRASYESNRAERQVDRRVDIRRDDVRRDNVRVRTDGRRDNVVRVRSSQGTARPQVQQTVVRTGGDGERPRSGSRGERGERGERGGRGDRDRND